MGGNIPIAHTGLLQPPMNCRMAKDPGHRDRGRKAQNQSKAPTTCPGPSRIHALFRPFLPAAGYLPLTSTHFLILPPPLPSRAMCALDQSMQAYCANQVGCGPGSTVGRGPREEETSEWPPAEVTGDQVEGPTCLERHWQWPKILLSVSFF